MPYIATTGVKKIQSLKKRIRAIAGGTSASKTIGCLLVLIDLAQSDKTPTLTSVVSESMPHMRKGAMLDFQNIMKQHNYWKEDRWMATLSTYTFETGSKIEFFGADDSAKQHGPRRQRLFMNEANNLKKNVFDQMEVRTEEFVMLDWNPTHEFWYYTDLLPSRKDDVDFITLTYKDNEALNENVVKSIESRRNNKNWWSVYGEGKLGEVEGRIYTNWQIIDEIPHEARLERRGLDFGFSNDPNALVDIYYYNGGYILKEQIYQRGMLNNQLADFVKNLPKPTTLIKADSAEPKSIAELTASGLTILPVEKGKDSVNHGIGHVQQQQISMTKDSINLIREYRNYMWLTDKDGNQMTVPDSSDDHLMDATRYGFEGLNEDTILQDIDLPVHEPLFSRTGY